MKNIQQYFLVLLSVLFLVAGCGGDPVKDDLSHYISTDLSKISPLEKEAKQAFTETMANKEGGAQALLAGLNGKVLPKVRLLIQNLETIQPATPEVQKVHAQYLAAVKEQRDALLSLVTALQKRTRTWQPPPRKSWKLPKRWTKSGETR